MLVQAITLAAKTINPAQWKDQMACGGLQLLHAHDGGSRPLAFFTVSHWRDFRRRGTLRPAMSGGDSISSPDEIAVLQAYIDLINSERETIWARAARCQFVDRRRACRQATAFWQDNGRRLP